MWGPRVGPERHLFLAQVPILWLAEETAHTSEGRFRPLGFVGGTAVATSHLIGRVSRIKAFLLGFLGGLPV